MNRKSIAALVGAGTLLASAGVAVAAIPDSDGVIHACHSKNSGALRVSDTGTCKSTEIGLSWNNVGPAGAVGAEGPKGDQGDPGTPGVSTALKAGKRETTNVANTDVHIVSLTVPAGSYVLQAKASVQQVYGSGFTYGLCEVRSGHADDFDFSYFDFPDGYPQGSTVSMLNTASYSASTTVKMTCYAAGRRVDVSHAVIVATKVGSVQ